ncbi:MAG: thiamine pyrophosphate-binding protein [Alphaproteobacteria bacterium]|nr:thiamine pyrophosphate-binding protein [Alphaproteobacteria bacterium]
MAKATRQRKIPKARNAATTELDRPIKLGNPRMGWASDAIAEVTRKLDFKYIALVPGASYRGFHDSLVNYLGNVNPQMLICLHEEHSVAIADGYARVSDKAMAVAIHTNVGLLHASMAIFCAFEGRAPMVMFGANGPIDANIRRPWIDWVHTSKDHAGLLRNFIKWDDEPQSAEAAVESVLRGNQIALSKPRGPVYICLDAGLQETALEKPIHIPEPDRYQPAPPPAATRATVRKAIAAIKKAKLPLMLVGRGDRNQGAWDNRVKLAEALGCAVMSKLRTGSSFPTEHPSHVVAPCDRPSEETKAFVNKADLIMNLGWMDFAGFLHLCGGKSPTQSPTNAEVINVSLEQYLHNGWNMDYQALPAVDINVLADPDVFVAQMLEELGVKGKPTGKPRLKPAVKRIRHWTKTAAAKAKPKASGPMMPNDFHLVMSDFVCSDPKLSLCHISSGFPGTAARWRSPLDFSGNDTGGGVGAGPGQSIGCALAYRDLGRIPVTMLGDGDYAMGVNALWTASRMRIPLLGVVMNNRSYFNDEAHQHHVADIRGRPTENRWIGLRIADPEPDVCKFAEAQGFEAEGPVKTVKELQAALARGRKVVAAGGRYMIDAWIEVEDALERRRTDGGRGEGDKKK